MKNCMKKTEYCLPGVTIGTPGISFFIIILETIGKISYNYKDKKQGGIIC